jgi:hypothetical protein
MAPGIVLLKSALVHCVSVHAPPGRLAQYFADGTAVTSRPDTVAFSAPHAVTLGKPGLPGTLRHRLRAWHEENIETTNTNVEREGCILAAEYGGVLGENI